MAVGRLTQVWVRAVLSENYSAGVVRKLLLDFFTAQLVSRRSHRGAKGRVALRLYRILAQLEAKGVIRQEAGLIHLLVGTRSATDDQAPPRELGPILQKLLFKALLAEDGQGDGHTPADLLLARKAFLASAIEAGWPTDEAARALGLKVEQATRILGW